MLKILLNMEIVGIVLNQQCDMDMVQIWKPVSQLWTWTNDEPVLMGAGWLGIHATGYLFLNKTAKFLVKHLKTDLISTWLG